MRQSCGSQAAQPSRKRSGHACAAVTLAQPFTLARVGAEARVVVACRSEGGAAGWSWLARTGRAVVGVELLNLERAVDVELLLQRLHLRGSRGAIGAGSGVIGAC